MITLQDLDQWLNSPAETEQLEFKQAKQNFSKTDLFRYCVALANGKGGHLILGVTDKPPRQVVGSQAFPSTTSLNEIKSLILQKLGFRVKTTELQHPQGRVLIFEIPSRPLGQPQAFEGSYLMRAGETLVPMTPDVLKAIFAEDRQDWFSQAARADVSSDDVIALLDTQTYFELLNMPYPTTRNGVLAGLLFKAPKRDGTSRTWQLFYSQGS